MNIVDMINKAYDEYIDAFNSCAIMEDKLGKLRDEAKEYTQGSEKSLAIANELKNIQKEVIASQRKFRLASFEIDRIKTLCSTF